uniref:F-box domain-containing protein n=1 Tax=Strongyloides venezuelensis TaxID=75913 RepID=A0A0K0G320_STRVS
MNSISDEKSIEEQNNIFVLPDGLLVRILSELSWKDILNIKLVSRSFYNFIHENYHQLNRRETFEFEIRHNKYCRRYPFHLRRLGKFPSREKKVKIRSSKELSRYIKVFDTRNLWKLDVYVPDSLDIFDIMNRSFQAGTKICFLIIPKVVEKDFRSFRKFINKISSVKSLYIERIGTPSTEAKDVPSFLSLSTLNTTNYYGFSNCDVTKILSADVVNKFLKREINTVTIGTKNIEFVTSVFKEYFTVKQPHKMKNECSCNKISFHLFFGGNFLHLRNTLKNYLCEFGNVKEVINISDFIIFESIVDCKYCLKNRHTIKRELILHKI